MDKVENEHNILNESYVNKLKGMDKILINERYWNEKHTKEIGELDCFAYRGRTNTAYIIETKLRCSAKNRIHALKQMYRAEKRFVPMYEQLNNININRIVSLYASNKGIHCENITYKR